MEVFYTSPWVPPEWIKAHGFEPRGVWFAKDLGSELLPASAGACAFANNVMRFAEGQADGAVVFSTHCDQLRRAFDAVGTASGRRFLFNLPATWQSTTALRLFAAELERMGRFLVNLGGHAPTATELRQTMNQYGLARRQLLEVAPHVPAREYAEAIARFHWDSTLSLPPLQECNSDAIPLAIIGGPLTRSQWHVLDLIVSAGGRIVLNATEAGERSLWYATMPPPTPSGVAGLPPLRALGEASLETLARLCMDSCCDVFQRPNTRLYQWLEARLASRQVRGIVLWHYVGCDLWRAEAQVLRETFGLPVLLLEAGETTSTGPRQLGRIEAFLESLRGPYR